MDEETFATAHGLRVEPCRSKRPWPTPPRSSSDFPSELERQPGDARRNSRRLSREPYPTNAGIAPTPTT